MSVSNGQRKIDKSQKWFEVIDFDEHGVTIDVGLCGADGFNYSLMAIEVYQQRAYGSGDDWWGSYFRISTAFIRATRDFVDIFTAWEQLDDENVSPEEFCMLLESLGYTDRTNPEVFAPATVRGKGVTH